MIGSGQIRWQSILVGAALAMAVVGCTSKFGDKDPGTQNADGFTVDRNLQANHDLDMKLAELDSSFSKIRDVLHLVRKMRDSDQNGGDYSHLDFLLDVNDELQTQPSIPEGGSYERIGSYNLNVQGLSPECELIDTKVDTMSGGGAEGTDDTTGETVDGIVYSVRTCHTAGLFVPIITATFASGQTRVQFNGKNIRRTLEDLFSPALTKDADCQVGFDDVKIVSSVQCTNLVSKISKSEELVINSISYDANSDTRFSVDGAFYGQTQDQDSLPKLKATVKGSISSSGQPSLSIQDMR